MPRENSNDHFPMWVGATLYFLSDREHTMNLFAYDGARARYWSTGALEVTSTPREGAPRRPARPKRWSVPARVPG